MHGSKNQKQHESQQLTSRTILNQPSTGCFNILFSRLPRYSDPFSFHQKLPHALNRSNHQRHFCDSVTSFMPFQQSLELRYTDSDEQRSYPLQRVIIGGCSQNADESVHRPWLIGSKTYSRVSFFWCRVCFIAVCALGFIVYA